MGCWNKTCGFTGLPIFWGDPVYVFVLEKQNNVEAYSPCNTTSEYIPVLAPFVSHYDDYGGGENSSGVWLPYLMTSVKEALIERDADESESERKTVKKDGFGVESFFMAVWANRLEINTNRYFGGGGSKEKTQVRFTMMLKEVVDELLSEFEIENCHSSFKPYTFDKVLPELPAVWDYLKSVSKDFLPLDTRSLTGENKLGFSIISTFMGWGYYNSLIDYTSFFRDLVNSGVEDSVGLSLLTDLAKGCFIDHMMDSLRKSWMPGGHEGSQQNDFEPYKRLYKACHNHMSRVEASEDLDE